MLILVGKFDNVEFAIFRVGAHIAVWFEIDDCTFYLSCHILTSIGV